MPRPGQPIRPWIPYFMLCVALVLTATATYYVATTSEARDGMRFQSSVMQTETIIRSRLDAYIAVLRAGNALFAASTPVTGAAFHEFFDHLDVRERYPGFSGIGYSLRVPDGGVDSLTAAMRAAGMKDFRVWPETPRDEYHAIIYIETIAPRRATVFGYDQFTDTLRRVAMERARDSARASATGILTFLQVPGEPLRRGVLMFYPVYRGGLIPPTVAERRALLAGFVYAGFRVNDILDGLFESEGRPRVAFTIYDGADTNASRILYRSDVASSSQPSYSHIDRLIVAGRTWTVGFNTAAGFNADSAGLLVPYIFLGGLAISFILFWLSQAQAKARVAAESSNARLAASEERYRSIVETAPDVIFTVSSEAVITSLSPAFESLSGWPAAEWVGKPFVPMIHPDDLERAFVNFQEVLAGRTPAPYELRVMTRSGAYLDIEFRTRPQYEDGAIIGAIGIARDITERRRDEQALRDSEARYRTFVEHSSEAIWRIELDASISTSLTTEEQIDCFYRHAYLAECNDAMARMYGFEAASQIVGARLGDLLVRSDPANVAYLAAFVESGYRLVDAESVEQDREGNIKYFANNLVGIVEDGVLARAWGMQRDITERRRAEAEVREAKEAAEAANRAKDQFLAVLSHELRTPLTPVLAALELLGEDAVMDGESRRLVELIDRNVELEARLIDDLLDLTKIANGKLVLNAETVDVHTLVRAAIDITRDEIRAKKLDVRLELAAARRWVQGDSGRLEQVFWNLVKNAVKFTPDGGRIVLRSFNEGEMLHIEVADTGIGIDEHVLPHIFNAFEQGEKTITRRFGGLGLGLAISKMLVDLHNGAIAAHSGGDGKGATFTVDLNTVDPPMPERPAPAMTAGRGGSHRLLLVDDHPDTTLVLKTLLERQGYQVVTASSVGTALEAASRDGFDLLISDIGLPDGTGHDIVRELRKRGPVKAIALSGFGMEEDIRRSLDAGFAEHLAKPVNFRTLHEAVQRLIGTHEG